MKQYLYAWELEIWILTNVIGDPLSHWKQRIKVLVKETTWSMLNLSWWIWGELKSLISLRSSRGHDEICLGRRWGTLTPDPVLCSSLRVQERIASVLDATCKGAWRLVVGMSCIAAQEVIDVKWIDVHTRERLVILYLWLVKGSQGYPLKRERSLEQAEKNMPICLQTSCQQKILGENETNQYQSEARRISLSLTPTPTHPSEVFLLYLPKGAKWSLRNHDHLYFLHLSSHLHKQLPCF